MLYDFFECDVHAHSFDEQFEFAKENKLLSMFIRNNLEGDVGSLCESIRQKQRDSAAETIKLLKNLRAHLPEGASFSVLKGISFGLCVYGNVTTRDVGDVDLLVSSSQVNAVHAALLDLGYTQNTGHSRADGVRGRALATVTASSTRKIAPPVKDVPMRRLPSKHELAPYTREGSPTVEIHDGFCRLPQWFLDQAILCAE